MSRYIDYEYSKKVGKWIIWFYYNNGDLGWSFLNSEQECIDLLEGPEQ